MTLNYVMREVYVNGPSFFGMWDGLPKEDICGGLTRTAASLWSRSESLNLVCDELINERCILFQKRLVLICVLGFYLYLFAFCCKHAKLLCQTFFISFIKMSCNFTSAFPALKPASLVSRNVEMPISKESQNFQHEMKLEQERTRKTHADEKKWTEYTTRNKSFSKYLITHD